MAQLGPLDGLWEFFDFTNSFDDDDWSDIGSDDSSLDEPRPLKRNARRKKKLVDPYSKQAARRRTEELSLTQKLSQIAEEVSSERKGERLTANGFIASNNKKEEKSWRRNRTDETPPDLAAAALYNERSPLDVVEGTALSLGRQVSKVADELAL